MYTTLLKKITLPKDKANHAFYLLFAYVALCVFISDYYALAIVVAVATLKEKLDSENPDKHTADIKDIYYGVAPSGIIYALGIIKGWLWL